MNEPNTQRPEEAGEQETSADIALPPYTVDARAYLQEIMLHTDDRVARIDRSQYFRYKSDGRILQQEVKQQTEGEPLSVLMIGVGNGEEPLSYLTAIHTAAQAKGKRLADVVGELELVELRPREEVRVEQGWGKSINGHIGMAFASSMPAEQQTLTPRKPPKEYATAFTFSPELGEYVFHPDIRSTLENSMNNPERAHFGTPIETFVQTQEGKTYAILACNNVLQHMGGVEGYPSPFKNPQQKDFSEYVNRVRKILSLVRPGGLLFLHTDGADKMDTKGRGTRKVLALFPEFFEEFTEVEEGIYRRNKQ